MKISSSTRFLKYYSEYYDKIYRYLYYRSNQNKEIAEDLTSDTFLKALEKFETYDSDRPFSAWIYTIAQNNLVDYYRKNDHYPSTSIEEHDIELIGQEDVPQKINEKFTHNQLLECIKKLPENFQEVLILKYFNDYTNKELEAMLNLNPNTLRTNLHRGLQMLRELVPATLCFFLTL